MSNILYALFSKKLLWTFKVCYPFIMKKILILIFICFSIVLIYSYAISNDTFDKKREEMVRRDIEARGIKDRKVLNAMLKVKRHLFVDPSLIDKAYNDHPLPIGEGQTISQPYIVALMTESLELKGDERVLEIGTGSGYQAAILAEIVKEVYTIEINKKIYEMAFKRLKDLGYKNIKVKLGDGYQGWVEYAPFDAIMVTAAAKRIPPPLLEQLKEGGRLIIPLGDTLLYQHLTLIKKEKGKYIKKHICDVRFVPMTGEVQK
ncbi:MAG: protein-L-isoaspartate(D-aspartate) O-methyltransferase [Syntrophorhabdaceae bacterium]|nr:protein-L-isoaspartate(D-aspartate) O-methyltransferase [Syntrophorhabdaceae bacterium]